MRSIFKLPFISILFIFFSCTDTKKKETIQSEKNGGVIRMSLPAKIGTLYPPYITQFTTITTAYSIYEGLVKLNPETLEVEPSLASSWEINKDATTYTFKLRSNAYYHKTDSFPGRKVTAYDVKHCLTQLCKPSDVDFYSKFLTQKVVGAKEFYESTKNQDKKAKEVTGFVVVNDSTFKINLKSSFLGFEKVLSIGVFVMYPPEIYLDGNYNDLNRTVGTGPFQIKNIVDGEKIELVKNENYWKKDKEGFQLPYLDGLNFSFNTSKKEEILAFKNKKLDLIKDIPANEIETLLPSLKEAKAGNNADFNYFSCIGLGVKMIVFNHNKEVFKNINVRKAFNYAINRRKLVDSVLLGDKDVAANGIIPPSEMFGKNNIKGFTHNPKKARELLALAGYPNGKGFPEVVMQSITQKVDSLTTNAVVNMINKTLNINIKTNNQNGLMELVGKYSREHSMDMWRYNWIADYPDPENFLQLFYGKNITKYNNEKFSELYQQALNESNEKKRYDIYFKADQELINDAACIPLFYNDIVFLTTKRIKNFKGNSLDYRDFREVYIEK